MQLLQRLKELGYRIRLEGTDLCLTWRGEGDPDPTVVRPLLEELRRRKDEAIEWLVARQQTIVPNVYCFNCFKTYGKAARYQPHLVRPSREFPGWLEYTCQVCGAKGYARPKPQ